jgi:hypothetical protein
VVWVAAHTVAALVVNEPILRYRPDEQIVGRTVGVTVLSLHPIVAVVSALLTAPFSAGIHPTSVLVFDELGTQVLLCTGTRGWQCSIEPILPQHLETFLGP